MRTQNEIAQSKRQVDFQKLPFQAIPSSLHYSEEIALLYYNRIIGYSARLLFILLINGTFQQHCLFPFSKITFYKGTSHYYHLDVWFFWDHMVSGKTEGESFVANRVSRGDCKKLTTNERGGEGGCHKIITEPWGGIW